VTAIAAGAKRALRKKVFSGLECPATASVEYKQGSLVGWDTATGLIRLGAASTTFKPIGFVTESKTLGAGGGSVHVTLFREVVGFWMLNDVTAPVVATDRGGLAYVLDDQTVQRTDATNTLSVLGMVWALDASKGVLVEPMFAAADPNLSGLDG
jgi:hypothetical protein